MPVQRACQKPDGSVRSSVARYLTPAQVAAMRERLEASPGDLALIGPGHDGWVIGDEPAVILDWAGAGNYGKPS